MTSGLTQEVVSSNCGMSQTQYGRIERAVAPAVTVEQLCRIGMVLGLDLNLKFFPGGEPLRDQPQAKLLDRFRPNIGPPLRCRTEVPVPLSGDQRAWDMWIVGGAQTVGVEAESRIRDSQAIQRRMTLKARDSGIECMILLVATTHANRAALHAAEAAFHDMFPVSARAALAALRAGRSPEGSAIILL